MQLKFNNEPKRPALPTLGQFVEQLRDDRAEPQLRKAATFLYDGYVYALIDKFGQGVVVNTDHGTAPCFNLKSQTVRAINLRNEIEPVDATVCVDHPKTHRYPHQC